MRRGLAFALSLIVVANSFAVDVTAKQTTGKPNVLFILIDDLNTSISSYGHPLVKAPNIERLAKRGVKFESAYCQYPLCNPSRASMFSGRRPDTTRLYNNKALNRDNLKDVDFLSEYYRKNGYFTAAIGKVTNTLGTPVKWDVIDPRKPNPNGTLTVRAGAGEQNLISNLEESKKTRQNKRTGGAKTGCGQEIEWLVTDDQDDDETDSINAARAIELIEKHKSSPFLITVGFTNPHLPYIAPERYFDMYPPSKINLPREPLDDRKDIPNIALPGCQPLPDETRRQAIAAYYAATTFMDTQVGRLLDTLDRLKLWDNTIVIFISDHGYHLGEHGGLWLKNTVFEEAARVPLIVAAPNKKSGVVSKRLVESIDLYPTLLELTGLTNPSGLEGTSLTPLLSEPNREWKAAAYTQALHDQVMGRSVRTERYRYTEWDTKEAELYDHKNDAKEYRNLINDPKYARASVELKRLLHEGWRSALPTVAVNRAALR